MKYDYNKILKRILDIGEQMVVFGAEVSRVEDSIERMCRAYDFKHTDIFIITTSMIVSVETREGQIITQTRRIRNLANDFDKLDYLNDLSRKIVKEKPTDEEIEKLFDQVLARKDQPKWLQFLAAALMTGGFTMFFGGSWQDCIVSALAGLAIMFVNIYYKKPDSKEVLYFTAVSFMAGIIALIMAICGAGENIDTIMIGTIMLLIPGAAMTNAIKDMVLGDTISGLLRLVQSLMIAASIAIGFAIALLLLGGVIL